MAKNPKGYMGKETEEWKQYQAGIDYNHKVDLYQTVNKNERFYAGDQWMGVVSNGLPTPVFNILKRIINYFVSSVLSQNVTLHFVPENVGDVASTEEEEKIYKENPNEFLIDIVKDEDWVYIESTVGADEYEFKK